MTNEEFQQAVLQRFQQNDDFQRNVLQALTEHTKILQEHSKMLLRLDEKVTHLDEKVTHLDQRMEEGFTDVHETLALQQQYVTQAFQRISALR